MCSLCQWMLEPRSAVWCTSGVYSRLYFVPSSYLSFHPSILGGLNCALCNIQSRLSLLHSPGQFPEQVQPFGPGVMVLSLSIQRRGRENQKYFSLMAKHIALRFTRWRGTAWGGHNVFLVNERVSGLGNF